MSQPLLALTMGDPSGIGPEVLVRAAATPPGGCRLAALGDRKVLASALERFAPELCLVERPAPEAVTGEAGLLEVLHTGDLGEALAAGQVRAASGEAACRAVLQAIDWALEGRVSGIVTAPLHKEALAAAGHPWPGHTELLAERAGAREVAMMMVGDRLRVVLVTIHCPLAEVPGRLTIAAELRALRLAHEGARSLGVIAPRIAVAGLNPHAGEGGRFGTEEVEVIAPAIAQARTEGLCVEGPLAGDTVFLAAVQGRFDVVVAQYHDQGLIPIKLEGLDRGVNVTLGLPFVRTSPDHGTAFDRAWEGTADPGSMRRAIEVALELLPAKGA
jgi:4-hydroxythreonine-4-phosphate dehydrogenase